jgi:hypothetical protein
MTMFFVLCAGEAGIVLVVLSLYRAATKPDVSSFLCSLPGVVFLCSSMIVAFSVGWTIHAILTSNLSCRKHQLMALGLNLVMLFLTLGTTEVMSFVLSKQTAAGDTLLGVLLYPKHWSAGTAQRKKAYDEMVPESSYYVHDPLLGWTVGRSRSDKNGQDLSSSEGLRSPRVGMSFADARARHAGLSTLPASIRVALVGDSMTFGWEVRCEETWGHLLEGLLQPHVQVLNFGVVGYGLNQAFLRYEKDVRPWHPQIVIIGISSEMIKRINSIYAELMTPAWGHLLARPRLIMKDDVPSVINYPLPEPSEILAYSTIQELPYIELDAYYRPFQWERGGIWHLFEQSYVFRFLYSLRPPTEAQPKDIQHEALLLSQVVTQYLVRKVVEDGAVPLIVWFPYEHELRRPADLGNMGHSLTRMLRDAGIEYYDPTDCLTDVGISEAYAVGGHYSPKGNAHIAECLEPLVRTQINRLRH